MKSRSTILLHLQTEFNSTEILQLALVGAAAMAAFNNTTCIDACKPVGFDERRHWDKLIQIQNEVAGDAAMRPKLLKVVRAL